MEPILSQCARCGGTYDVLSAHGCSGCNGHVGKVTSRRELERRARADETMARDAELRFQRGAAMRGTGTWQSEDI